MLKTSSIQLARLSTQHERRTARRPYRSIRRPAARGLRTLPAYSKETAQETSASERVIGTWPACSLDTHGDGQPRNIPVIKRPVEATKSITYFVVPDKYISGQITSSFVD